MKATLPDNAATPPVAAKRPAITEIHRRTRVDEYAWLRDRQSAEVGAYLEAEEAYARAVMAPTEPLQERLYDEILSHIKQTDLSVPYRLGNYWYYSRTEEGKQYPILARKRETPAAAEEITLDLNALAEGHAYFAIGAYQVSDDGHLLAYSVDLTGYRQYTLHVKDLRSGAGLDEAIERVSDVVWAADNTTLYYTTEDDVSKRHDRFWRHALGSPESTLLYEESDERYDVGAQRSRDRAFVFLASYSKATTEWQALRTDRAEGELQVIIPRSEGHRADVAHHGSSFYITTNRDAEDFRVVVTPDDAPQESNWREVIPARPGVHLDGLDVFERYAVVVGRSGGFPNLEILDLADHALRPIELPEAVHSVAPGMNPEYGTSTYRFSYASLVTPASVYEIDLATDVRRLLKETEVPGYDRSHYATELTFATAPDGTHVPMSLVFRNDVPRDGSAPMLLYAYGSYGHPIDPTFSAARLVLLDRGVVFAIAHVRGGGELGERWRTAGHLREKLNTFHDFIACAEHAIAQKYTSAPRLAIQGASAGGLLVAAVANMRPDLFRAVVCQVPFVDVVNTMLDASLPLTTAEYLEWGDPNDEGDYDYMMGYSPYDNVASQAYPAMLVRVSLNDSQVPYWEGAKLVARIRAHKTDKNSLLLAVNFGAGHGGASGRYDNIRETTLNYAFILAEIQPNPDST
ncbi:MAG: S9 family peptidase [Candidatus Eremiobacteraeota bacterium]|nr:S9 family peptidase [Candidatus Eremiobacteraeota bacterium]